MKTDALFYELFKIVPQALLELAGLTGLGSYRFESLTFKATEKRLDGFFRSLSPQAPHLFLEVQGYPDGKIYWRLLREVAMYYEQHPDTTAWQAVVLFLERPLDPGVPAELQSLPIRRIYLAESLERVGAIPSPLVVLKPLVAESKAQLAEEGLHWKEALAQLNLADSERQLLLKLLIYATLERFPDLTAEEMETMITLVPVEQTVVGQELIQKGEQKGLAKGREEGEQKGELIGRIQLYQELLKKNLTPKTKLQAMSVEELQTFLETLKQQFSV